MRKKKNAQSGFDIEDLHPHLEVKFRNQSQASAWKTIDNNSVTFLTGPAGTAKTFIAVAYALLAVYNSRTHSKIIITRPLVDAGEELGILPGDVEEKTAPFLQPIYEALDKICTPELRRKLKPAIDEVVKVQTVGCMRGLTFEDSICILDEAQNLTHSQMTMYLTRFGHGSKMIICGDVEQSDIRNSVLHMAAKAQVAHGGVGWFEFSYDDVVRPKLVSQMAQTMKQIKL